MSQESTQFELNTVSFQLARQAFHALLKHRKDDPPREEERLDQDLTRTLQTLVKNENGRYDKLSADIKSTLNPSKKQSLDNDLQKQINHPDFDPQKFEELSSEHLKNLNNTKESFNTLKKSLAKCLFLDELQTYRTQRKIRGSCYAAIVATAGVAVFKNASSPDWADTPYLAITLAVGLVAALILLGTNINKLDRTELIALGKIAGITGVNKELGVLDVHPFNLHKWKNHVESSGEPSNNQLRSSITFPKPDFDLDQELIDPAGEEFAKYNRSAISATIDNNYMGDQFITIVDDETPTQSLTK